ncbi:hypothetical protein LMH87_005003 [Akanthomyces muscarius]|uniref:Uncharacterized protein n=1 Tax=Akanthomyces muscarius TaxID=2231603 RepID=A0A9W8QNA2_AKAMU|nr:hypothetical protein LMH87_005003 [Akanthomyces muscarius]KAJ4163262.1 hypothetical protein LMH87_005003 [Akanthomyces muscarius]
MALTIKQLNGDASFLLTFEPIETSDVALSTQPFHVLLDPRIATASSSSSSVVAALQDLPDIDLVLVSSARSDHCHEATLRQLPSTSKTRILAEPAAARRIRGWRCFDKGTVEALPRWEDCPAPGKEERRVLRIPILPQVFGGEPGEMTLTYLGQKREAHAAIGITYRPPTVSPTAFRRGNRAAAATPNSSSPIPPCPPRLPTPALSFSDAGSSSSSSSVPGSPASSTVDGSPMLPAMPPPPLTRTGTRNSSGGTRRRRSGRAVQSCATWRSLRTLSPHSLDRGVSVIFAPHGIPYRALQSYATTHLLRQAVLPLTALLHCFDAPAQPWYLGGSSGGMPMGQETASALGAKAWISCHDGEKDVGRGGGVVGRLVGKKQRFVADEVQRALDASHAQGMASPGNLLRKSAGHHPTEVLALEAGEEIAMTSEGIWEEETLFADDKGGGGLLGLGLRMGEDEEGRIVTGAPALDWW